MSIPTVAVTCTAYDQNGNAVAGGTFRARLNSTEIYNGFVVPEQVTGVADASGVCVLQLWPNALGVAGSAYRITAINPDTGQKYLDTTAVVPNSACSLHQIIVAAPYPTVDASEQALIAAQGALAAVTAQAGIATTKAAEASASATTATTQAGIATTQAGTATTQAGIATTQATTATTQADIAATQAGIATTQAGNATTQANTAIIQTGIAITKASEAAASAATATTQAGTATTQAGVATTKASEAAASATNANNSAYTAGLSVDAAVTAKNQAVSSASAAASSATAASGSATAASTSASSASASASTATTQAGTATTQAGLATTAATTATSKASEASTYASNASASANTATTQAGVATTQAGIATTQAGIATTQAGIAIANANAALSVYGSVTAQQAAVTAAQNAATSATASAAAANTSAGNASGSAASALAIYGTTAAQQAALTNAQSAASLAQGYALSASSAIQQDLSGVTAQALHRSPNAVTAMFVYDTSKDSDGGAWTEKCQHTSWYNEALNGKWFGAHTSEQNARYYGAIFGSELVANGTFNSNITGVTTSGSVGTGTVTWNPVGAMDLVAGSSGTANADLTALTTVSGTTYALNIFTLANPSGTVGVYVGTTSGNNNVLNATIAASATGASTFYFTATGTTTYVRLNKATANVTATIDNVSVREVTALTTASGDYYQSTVDGKFYRLWKNLLTNSNTFTNYNFTSISGTITPNSSTVTAPDGTNTATEIAFTGGGGNDFAYRNAAVPAGTTYSVWMRTASGTRTIALRCWNTGAYVTHTVTTTWQRFSFTVSSADATGLGFDNRTSYGASGTAGSIFVATAQLEYGSTATPYEAKTIDGSVSETFRGNKADFPRLAGIVAEAQSVTIYDLTEAGRPMWMRFVYANSSDSGSTWFFSVANPSCVAALGGKVAFGTTGQANTTGLNVVDFPNDELLRYANNTARGGRNRLVANRLSTNNLLTNTMPALANGAGGVNAVAMTILPDAPVDAVTGLQVPTIAVATAGGVSVIKHNGTVVNSNNTGAAAGIVLTPYALMAHYGTTSAQIGYAYSPGNLGPAFTLLLYQSSQIPDFVGPVTTSTKIANAGRSSFARSSSSGTIRLLRQQEASSTRGIATAISNTFNTGHLIGDIRRAYLADVDVGSVSGTELVTNGYNFTDTTDWIPLGGADVSVVGGNLLLTANNDGYPGVAYPIACTSGVRYYVTVVARKASGNYDPSLFVRIGALESSDVSGTPFLITGSSTFTTKTFSFVANATSTHYIQVRSTLAGITGTVEVNRVSVMPASAVVLDRSYKAQAAAITGTLTKTQVAAASQLVAYSGFSAANYLREPYSADLDFGTGEWSASAWVNVPLLPTLPANVTTNTIGGNLAPGGGTFDSTTGYVLGTNWTFTGGQAVTSNGTGVNLTVNAGLTVGKSYLIEFDVVVPSSIALNFAGQGYLAGDVVGNNIPSSGRKRAIYTATQGVVYFQGQVGGITLDNLSITEVLPFQIAERSFSSGPKINLGITPDGKLTATAFDGTTTRTVTTTAAYNTATWIKPEAVYTTDGTLAIRVNGVEVAATRGTPLLTLNNSNAVLTIGNSYAADAPFPGSIALLKLSATVPTAEQSQWMYEQEKQMFRDGAQVTLPDAGSIVDLAYDDATDKWLAVSATNESEWSGLVRTSVTPSPAGSYSKISAASGIQLQARTTTNPGVDVTIPSYGLREELVNRSQAAARLARNMVAFDYVGGFTANTTTGSTAIASVASLTYPVSYVGARISGAGIPANTTVVAVSGTTIYMSAAATATASGVQISFVDFNLPVGYEAREVSLAGVVQREGATSAWQRLYDGFKETIRFGTAPSYTALVQIQAVRSNA